MTELNNAKQQLLLGDVIPESLCPSFAEMPELVDTSCPDCDGMLDVSYDNKNNPAYYCDNCGCSVLGTVVLSMGDMDITQDTEA